MSIDIQILEATARITIADSFDSSSYTAFKQAYTPLIASVAVQVIEVDVCGLQYLDSSALGMLIQLNERAKEAKKSIALVSVPGRIADIMKVANADKLFTINLPSGMKLNLRN